MGLRCTHKSGLATFELFRPLNPPILGDFEGSAPPELGAGGPFVSNRVGFDHLCVHRRWVDGGV
jgi:hypothetical protein